VPNLSSGKIRIGRPHTGGADEPERPIRIEITDSISGVRFCTAHLSPAEFAGILTGTNEECALELYLSKVGMREESKEVFVPVVLSKDIGVTQASLAPFEVDGWKARRGDFGNHHRGSYKEGFRVVFCRHVKVEQRERERILSDALTYYAQKRNWGAINNGDGDLTRRLLLSDEHGYLVAQRALKKIK